MLSTINRPMAGAAVTLTAAMLAMAGGRPHRPPPGGRPQGTRSAGCRTNPRLSPPP